MNKTIEISAAIDISGSISQELFKGMLNQIKIATEKFENFRLRVWCFDTNTYEINTYRPDNLDKLLNMKFPGWGRDHNTIFECNWEMMKEEDIVPDQFIFCTDGFPCKRWGDPDYCDTLFLIHSNQYTTAPFGTTVHYEEAVA